MVTALYNEDEDYWTKSYDMYTEQDDVTDHDVRTLDDEAADDDRDSPLFVIEDMDTDGRESHQELQILPKKETGVDICQLPLSYGNCSSNMMQTRVYYDQQSGRCIEFAYTGCGGNANNFATFAECDRHCRGGGESLGGQGDLLDRPPPPISRKYSPPTSVLPQMCRQRKDIGTCYGKELQWYFDMDANTCRSFQWSGCGGNTNRFHSEEHCLRACGDYRDQEVCFLSPDQGPCMASVSKWYYDSIAGACAQFIYGGCNGNGNRFSSKEDCAHLCREETRVGVDMCRLTPDSGPCGESETKWFYSSHSEKCEQFVYGGCDGNENKFATQADCEKRCIRPKESVTRCSLPKDHGPCLEPVSMYYFDLLAGECRLFTYGGCRGNENKFETLDECQAACQGSRVGRLVENRDEICRSPFARGRCSLEQVRYFYDVNTGRCETFIYSGCEGNENKFYSEHECRETCAGVTLPLPDWGMIPAKFEAFPSGKIEITVDSSPPRFDAGQMMTVRCEQFDKDRLLIPIRSRVHWYKDGRRVDPSQRIEIRDTGVLVVNSLIPDDSGNYSCALPDGSTSSAISIFVADSSTPPPVSGDDSCRDDSSFGSCPMVKRAGLCSHAYYSKFCCATCQAKS